MSFETDACTPHHAIYSQDALLPIPFKNKHATMLPPRVSPHPNSYQTLQNQSRAGSDGGGGGSGSSSTAVAAAGNSSTGASSAGASGGGGGERRGSVTSGPRPPSISMRHGFSDALVDVGSSPVTPDTGAAFNLLGLPPSPAPRSGAIGASAWGATVGGGGGGGGTSRSVGDMMAGQVRAVVPFWVV